MGTLKPNPSLSKIYELRQGKTVETILVNKQYIGSRNNVWFPPVH